MPLPPAARIGRPPKRKKLTGGEKNREIAERKNCKQTEFVSAFRVNIDRWKINTMNTFDFDLRVHPKSARTASKQSRESSPLDSLNTVVRRRSSAFGGAKCRNPTLRRNPDFVWPKRGATIAQELGDKGGKGAWT